VHKNSVIETKEAIRLAGSGCWCFGMDIMTLKLETINSTSWRIIPHPLTTISGSDNVEDA
jgi:hypothetical protein